MNLKKTFLSTVAAATIALTGVFGAAAQNSDTSQGQVNVGTGGTFNVFICHSNATQNELINFGSATLTSQNPTATKTAQLVICYTDTQPHRGAFKTYLSSTNFEKDGQGWNQIAKSNLRPTWVHNVGQGQWGTGIGNIGGRTSAGVSVNAPGGLAWGSGDFSAGSLWVGHGNAGIGTASHWYYTQGYAWDARSENGSWAPIDLELTIPSTTVAGLYKNTFTVDVTFDTP